MLSVKDSQVTGTGDCRIRRMLPTQARDEPQRYIDHGSGCLFFVSRIPVRLRFVDCRSPTLDSGFRRSICVERQGFSGGWDADCRIRRMLPTQAGYEPRFRTKNGAGDRVDELAGQ